MIQCHCYPSRTFRFFKNRFRIGGPFREISRSTSTSTHSSWNFLLTSRIESCFGYGGTREKVLFIYGSRSIVWIVTFGTFGTIHRNKVSCCIIPNYGIRCVTYVIDYQMASRSLQCAAGDPIDR